MKKPSRLKTSLSLLLVSVLAATIMPTSVNAETTDFEDNEVTVEVDLGSGTDPELCEGFASLTVPGDTLPATLNRRVNGDSSPSMADLLGYFWGEYNSYDQIAEELYDNVDLQTSLDILNNVGNLYSNNWNAVKNPADATIDTLVSIDYEPIVGDGIPTQYRQEDLDEDGDIDINDAPGWLTETRRSYSTDWFTVSYDASDCMESDDMALVMVTRTPTLRAPGEGDDGRVFVEAEIENDGWDSDVENKAEAYLKIRTNLIGGLVSLPYEAAWNPITDFADYDSWDVDPVAFGDEGSAQMRSMMNIYGASPTGIYQANYYYQLEVNDEEYFFDEFDFFGDCFPFGCP
jgi:hypothetical protein